MNEKVRQEALKILMNQFPKESPKSIYECAQEWSEKQVTTNGLVNYYKTYYNKTK
tara:strand:+ start:740 stop:904 length:165 start_codon:yes stop_codon:yes gene_type:complete